jgi:hypothetical protein
VTTHGGTAAERFELTEVQAQALMKRGINNMQLLVMNTMFIGGLKEEIHTKVLETGPTQIQASVKLAREIEIISKDKKEKVEKGAYINSVQASHDAAALPAEDIEVLEIDQEDVPSIQNINVIRRQMNKPPLKFLDFRWKLSQIVVVSSVINFLRNFILYSAYITKRQLLVTHNVTAKLRFVIKQ